MSQAYPTRPPHLPNALCRWAALAAEPLYRTGIAMRNTAFSRGWRKAHRARVPVISIGNLTTGGTGKTPMVVYVCHTLQAYGSRPAVILRGYRRDASGRSDEQEMLADLLPETPIIANPDRVAAARQVDWEYAEADAIVLDDGFQHRRLHRDLDIVLMDATNPFGFGHVLPRGLMREPPSSLRRADAVVLTRCDLVEEDALTALSVQIRKFHGRSPIAHTAHAWGRIIDERDQPVRRSGSRVFIITGIGNPEAFLEQAARHFTIVGTRLLPDHARYNRRTVTDLHRELEQRPVDAVLTSEKDWVKLRRVIQSRPLARPVWRPQVWMGFLRGEKAFNRLLLSAVTARSETAVE